MSFNKFNRRLHLYLGLLLLPWVLMYGVSSFTINHNDYFQRRYDDGVPPWTERLSRPYDRPLPENGDLKQFGAEILADLGLEGDFHVRRAGTDQLHINVFDFWSMTRVTYEMDELLVRVDDRRFQWNHFFIWMHERSGFHSGSALRDAWAVIVDMTCIGFLVFIASGLYMWWQLKQSRLWGFIALGGGVTSFVLLLLAL